MKVRLLNNGEMIHQTGKIKHRGNEIDQGSK